MCESTLKRPNTGAYFRNSITYVCNTTLLSLVRSAALKMLGCTQT